MNTRALPSRSPRMMRALSVAAIGAAALILPLAIAAPASAHSQLVSTDPTGDGPNGESVIDALPDSVSLTFSDDLTPPLPAEQQQDGESTTQIRVYDETCTDAALLIADPGHADTRDCTDYAVGEATVDGPTVSTEVDNTDAPAGAYTVVWQVVYGDGHADSQMFTFTADNAVTAEATPTSEPTAAPSETQAPSETPSADPSSDVQTADPSPSTETETPSVLKDNSPLSTAAVVAIVGGGLVLLLVIFIVIMIARARRQ